MQTKLTDPTQTVTLTISDGTVMNNIPWTQGMNVQSALEAAYNISVNPPTPSPLSYWIEYFGTSSGVYLGYLVTMVDGITQMGNMYWFVYVNQVSATSGIDSTTLNAGDQILLKYEPYSEELHGNTMMKLVHQLKTSKKVRA